MFAAVTNFFPFSPLLPRLKVQLMMASSASDARPIHRLGRRLFRTAHLPSAILNIGRFKCNHLYFENKDLQDVPFYFDTLKIVINFFLIMINQICKRQIKIQSRQFFSAKFELNIVIDNGHTVD